MLKPTARGGAGVRSGGFLGPAGDPAGGKGLHIVQALEQVGPGGGPAGDLYVELSVEPHDTFKRNGDDLEMVIKLPMTAAARF